MCLCFYVSMHVCVCVGVRARASLRVCKLSNTQLASSPLLFALIGQARCAMIGAIMLSSLCSRMILSLALDLAHSLPLSLYTGFISLL